MHTNSALKESPNAEGLHREALVADLHCDTVFFLRFGFDLADDIPDAHIDLPRLEQGGVNLQVFACFVHPQTPAEYCVEWTDHLIGLLTDQFRKHDSRIALATGAREARRIIDSGRIAAVLAIENGQAIAGDPANLEHFYDQGVRLMTLSHARSHDWCSSSSDSKAGLYGLTDLGERIVKRMNELGMVVDVSHVSPRAFDDVLDVTTAPVVASHSCAHALCAHDRNLTDRQIHAMAANGGVIGINFCGVFLSPDWQRRSDAFIKSSPRSYARMDRLTRAGVSQADFEREWAALRPFTDAAHRALDPDCPTVFTVADHIDHISALVGAGRIAIGSDFDGIFRPPEGLDDCAGLPNLTAELVRRGYRESEVRNILGENFMRVFSQVRP